MRKPFFVLAAFLWVFIFTAVSVQAVEKNPAKKEEPKGLSALVVKFHMKAEFREQFIKEKWVDAIESEKKEPGCLMFNIMQDKADPNILYMFEVYKDANALEAHHKAPYFLKSQETTKEWLAAPPEITPVVIIYPPEGFWKKRPAPEK